MDLNLIISWGEIQKTVKAVKHAGNQNIIVLIACKPFFLSKVALGWQSVPATCPVLASRRDNVYKLS